MQKASLNLIVRRVLIEAPTYETPETEAERMQNLRAAYAGIFLVPFLVRYSLYALATIGAVKIINTMVNASIDKSFRIAEYLRRKQSDGKIVVTVDNKSKYPITIKNLYGGYILIGSTVQSPDSKEKRGETEAQRIAGNATISPFRMFFNNKPHSDSVVLPVSAGDVQPGTSVDVVVDKPANDNNDPLVAVHALVSIKAYNYTAETYVPVGFKGRIPEHVIVFSQEMGDALAAEAEKSLKKAVKKAEKDVLGPYDPGPSRVPYGTSSTAAEADAKYEEGMDYMDRGDFGNAALSFAEAVDAGAGMKAHLMRIRAYIRQGDAADFPENAQSYYKLALQELQAVQGFATGATREQKAEAESFKRQVLKKMGKI